MNCAWCGSENDGSDSHGICDSCADAIKLQSVQRQWDRTPSYVKMNAAAFAKECQELLEQEEVMIA